MNNRFGNERQRYGEFGPSRREERFGSRSPDEDDRSSWGRGDEGEGSGWGERYDAQSREPRYSSDHDETYGSEWQRGGDQPHGAFQQGRERGQGTSRGGQGSFGRSSGQGSFGQRDESRPGWYSRGHTGSYGGGSGGGYQGGYGGGGYGGSSGTNYTGGSEGGYGGSQGYGGTQGYGASQGYGGSRAYGGQRGYGGGQGSSLGASSFGSRGSFGSSSDQGFRSRDFGSPGSDLSSNQRGSFAGRGPKGYTRTDERIREDVCDRLSMDDDIDASEIDVRVENGEVTLEGTVPTRSMKHQAEDLAEDLPGVKDVHNKLRVMKGFLNELKDKMTGNEDQGHYANTGTKSTTGTASSQTTVSSRS
jgi:hypothetical protein